MGNSFGGIAGGCKGQDRVTEIERRRRFGLRPQLLLLLFVLNLVAAVAYSTMLYSIDRREIISGIDDRLMTAVHAAREIIPQGYHRRIQGPDSIPTAEFGSPKFIAYKVEHEDQEPLALVWGDLSSVDQGRDPALRQQVIERAGAAPGVRVLHTASRWR